MWIDPQFNSAVICQLGVVEEERLSYMAALSKKTKSKTTLISINQSIKQLIKQ